ncbi:MAG: chemotaxis protein CheW [Bdellovibrionota bacterium]
MSDGDFFHEGRVAELRKAFDQTFVFPPREQEGVYADLLAVDVGGDPYAVPLLGLSGLYSGCRIALVPGPVPELIGVAGIRGSAVPVYGLRQFLGYPDAAPSGWLVVSKESPRAGFSFDGFRAYARVAAADVVPSSEGGGARPYLCSAARIDGVAIPVLDVPILLDEIARKARAASNSK